MWFYRFLLLQQRGSIIFAVRHQWSDSQSDISWSSKIMADRNLHTLSWAHPFWFIKSAKLKVRWKKLATHKIQRDVKRKSSRCCFHQIRYRQASLCARPMDYCHGKPAFGPPRWASLQLSLVNVIYFFPARAQIQTSLWSSNDLQLGQRGRIFWLLWWRWRRS